MLVLTQYFMIQIYNPTFISFTIFLNNYVPLFKQYIEYNSNTPLHRKWAFVQMKNYLPWRKNSDN